jgi:protein ImuB
MRLPAPVRGLRLHAMDLPRFVPASRELFDPRPQQQVPWGQVRERLRARLGDHAVQGVGWRADHRPERVADACATVPRHVPPMPRPGWLLVEPSTMDEVPVRIVAGPERIESGWWDLAEADVRRDYYVVETDSGRRAWAYRPIRYGRAIEEAPLVLHGWFA